MSYTIFETFDEFTEACRAADINSVALRAVNERRAKVAEEGVITGRVQQATVLAYDSPQILKLTLEEPPAKIHVMLMKAGFEVKRRDEVKT